MRKPTPTIEPRQRGFTLVELLIVMVLIAVLASLTIAGVTRSRARGEEAAAIQALRTIHSAQDAFRAICGHDRDYAATLPQLGAAQTISPDLAAGEVVAKSGYRITITPTGPGEAQDTCTRADTAAHWYAAAAPDDPQSHRGFATTDDDDVWQDLTGIAPPAPFTPSPKVSRIGRQ